ncbi:MAG: hypothetical protein VKL59_18475 [Nostocaceae cyanobacterium]|nr:hypothetical protein [Nostocaceae cyanobacterium]
MLKTTTPEKLGTRGDRGSTLLAFGGSDRNACALERRSHYRAASEEFMRL